MLWKLIVHMVSIADIAIGRGPHNNSPCKWRYHRRLSEECSPSAVSHLPVVFGDSVGCVIPEFALGRFFGIVARAQEVLQRLLIVLLPVIALEVSPSVLVRSAKAQQVLAL